MDTHRQSQQENKAKPRTPSIAQPVQKWKTKRRRLLTESESADENKKKMACNAISILPFRNERDVLPSTVGVLSEAQLRNPAYKHPKRKALYY